MPFKDKNKQKQFQKEHYKYNKQFYTDRHKNRRKALKKWLLEDILLKSRCEVCGESDPACLDFHHIDPSTKIATVSKMVHSVRKKEDILKEIQKCKILCANCHRKEHKKILAPMV